MTSNNSLRTFFLMHVLFTFISEGVTAIKVKSEITDNKLDTPFELAPKAKMKQESKTFLELEMNGFHRHRRDSGGISTCEEFGSCEANLGKTVPLCHCDNKCRIFMDCCFDAKAYLNDLVNDTEFNTLKVNNSEEEKGQEIPRLQHKAVSETCNRRISRNIRFPSYRGFHFIDECPALYPVDETVERCTRNEDMFPVSSPDGITYSNMYCAACNNILEYEVWSFKFGYNSYCTRDVISSMIDNSAMETIEWITRNCFYTFLPPKTVPLRYCLLESGLMSTTLPCPTFSNPVFVKERNENGYSYKAARNIPCAIEQNISISKFDCFKPENYGDQFRSYDNLDMVGMFNIRPAFEIFGQKRCQSGYTYVAQKDLCLPEDCGKDQAVTTETCTFETIKNAIWRIDKVMTFIADDLVDFVTFLRILISFELSLPEVYQLSIDSSSRFGYKCEKALHHPGKFCCYVHNLYIVIGRELTATGLNRFISSAEVMKWTYQETRNSSTIHASHDFYTKEIDEVCNVNENRSVLELERKIRPPGFKMIRDNLLFTNGRSGKPEIPISFNIKIVKINDKDGISAMFEVKKWELVYGSAAQQQKMKSSWSATTILTYITLGTSSISLLLAMVVYRYLELSLTPPGIISQNMMGTLLAAQLLFLSGAGASAVNEICLVVGIISHYIWLSAFAWITAFMINVLRTMRRMYTCPGASVCNSKLSKFMYCFGYLLPLLIVLPCVFLEIFSDTNIGYTDNLCFPTGYPVNIFAFSLPILVSLIINLVALVATSYAITRFNNTKVLSTSIKGMRTFIPIYIRLISICSCPWIIGMLADILDVDVLRYVFTILAGCQGTFVSLSFLTAKSVKSKIRDYFRKKTTEAAVPLPTLTHTPHGENAAIRISKIE